MELTELVTVTAIGSEIYVNDERIYVTSKGYIDRDIGIRMEKIGIFYSVSHSSIRIKWDTESSWFITLDHGADNEGYYAGLCGNGNGNPYGTYYCIVYKNIKKPKITTTTTKTNKQTTTTTKKNK